MYAFLAVQILFGPVQKFCVEGGGGVEVSLSTACCCQQTREAHQVTNHYQIEFQIFTVHAVSPLDNSVGNHSLYSRLKAHLVPVFKTLIYQFSYTEIPGIGIAIFLPWFVLSLANFCY